MARNIEEYTQKYIDDKFEFIQAEYRRKTILEIIKKIKPNSLLEIGCGMKPLFVDLEDIQTTVVDPSVKFCENAKKYNAEGKHTVINDFFDCNFSDKYKKFDFEMVICSGLLHEVEHPMLLLKAISKVCSDSSIVHVNVPNAKSLHRILAKEVGLISDIYEMSERNIQFQQHSVFDMESLVSIIEQAGFEIIGKGSYFVKPFTHGQMQRMLDEKIIDKKILDGLEQLIQYVPDYGSEIYVNCRMK